LPSFTEFRAVAQIYPVACSGVNQRNFDFESYKTPKKWEVYTLQDKSMQLSKANRNMGAGKYSGEASYFERF